MNFWHGYLITAGLALVIHLVGIVNAVRIGALSFDDEREDMKNLARGKMFLTVVSEAVVWPLALLIGAWQLSKSDWLKNFPMSIRLRTMRQLRHGLSGDDYLDQVRWSGKHFEDTRQRFSSDVSPVAIAHAHLVLAWHEIACESEAQRMSHMTEKFFMAMVRSVADDQKSKDGEQVEFFDQEAP